MYAAQSYSRDVLGFLFLVLTLVALITSRNRVKAPLLLNRKQTEEWKGWMQVSNHTHPQSWQPVLMQSDRRGATERL